MDEMRKNIREVAQVLLSINVPVRLFAQIGEPVAKCADRLIYLAEAKEEKPAQEEPEQEAEA